MKKLKMFFLMAVVLLTGILNADSITGTVLDVYGNPVQYAFVEALAVDSSYTPAGQERYFTEANANGEFVLEIEDGGNFIVYGDTPLNPVGDIIYFPEFYDNVQSMYEASFVFLSGNGDIVSGVDFSLESNFAIGNGEISGLVTDDNGNAVQAAIVKVQGLDSYFYNAVVTNADGSYSMDNIVDGDYIVEVWTEAYAPYFYENATNEEDATVLTFEDGTNFENIDMILTGLVTYSISGVVLDNATGEPIVGLDMAASQFDGWNSGHGITNTSGEYTMEVIEGSYLVHTMERAPSQQMIYATQYWDHKLSPVEADLVEVTADVADINFDLLPAATHDNSISGSIIFEGQIPNFDVYLVAISSEEEWEESAFMAEDGTYEITNLPDGDFFVLAVSGETAAMYYENTLNFDNATPLAVSGNVTGIDFDLEAIVGDGYANLTGTVTDETGNAVANTSIIALNADGDVWSYVRTDDNGNYTINNLASGNYTAFATKVFYESDNSLVNIISSTTEDFQIQAMSALSIDDNNNSEISNFDLGNYPNPFNPETSINFSIKNNAKVNLTVFNSKGEMVKEVTNTNLTSGSHRLHFDGSSFNSGVYYYTLSVDDKKVTKKMVLIK